MGDTYEILSIYHLRNIDIKYSTLQEINNNDNKNNNKVKKSL